MGFGLCVALLLSSMPIRRPVSPGIAQGALISPNTAQGTSISPGTAQGATNPTRSDLMFKLKNALAAGTIVASALIAPVTMPAQFAGASADTVAGTTASALTFAGKPCSKHKNPAQCRARRGGGAGAVGGAVRFTRARDTGISGSIGLAGGLGAGVGRTSPRGSSVNN
jgi:hypothetical protein